MTTPSDMAAGSQRPLRIVNLGLPKSGTTTLARALKLSGFKVADYRIRTKQTDNTAIHRAFVGDLMYRGYYGTGDPLYELDEFDAFTEISCLRERRNLWPQTDFALIRAIRDHHPGVRFLASNRDVQALSDSMLRWSDLGTKRLPRTNIPGLPTGFGASGEQRMRWINGHYQNLRHFFAGADDFLEYDVADPAAPSLISAHLGRDIAWWGKANTNTSPKPEVA